MRVAHRSSRLRRVGLCYRPLDASDALYRGAQRQQRHQFSGFDLGDRREIAAGLGNTSHALKLQLDILDLDIERERWRIHEGVWKGSGHGSAFVSSAADDSADARNFADAQRTRRDEHHEEENLCYI
jgi:hypothetical protein